ncbi:DnaJ domain-containing protein [Mastigocladopsis repens]|uniref:DnaJ domain-containing protein n=1 Tax=Mastigocladopsis repens TaxID=221287 RepID=UPI00031B6CCE|nr:DnaJ domain-containing protein [Mastigocladopsis repens]
MTKHPPNPLQKLVRGVIRDLIHQANSQKSDKPKKTAGISATVGGMGLAGGFGAVGIGTAPVVGAGGVVGAAVYGAFKAIAEGDAVAFGALGVGAIGGASVSSVVGGMGLVAPKIGLAVGIGTIPMAAVGAVVGLAAYGIAKLLDESGTAETPAQVFDRMEEKVLQMEAYSAAVMELEAFLSGENLNQKFAALEVEDELQMLKAEIDKETETNSSPSVKSEISAPNIETKVVSLNTQLPETWRCVQTLKGHTAAVNAIAISPDGQTLASGSNDTTVKLWNLKTGTWLYTFAGQEEAVLSVAISPDGKILASGSVARKISYWYVDTKKFLRTFFYLNSPYSHTGFVYSVAFSPDGKILASGSGDKSIRLWGRYTGEVKRTLNGHSDTVLSIVISPNGKILASGSTDQTIRLWDLNNWGQSRILTEHLEAVNTVVISPDGETLISGSTDTTIKLWNLHSGELLHTLTGHSTAIVSLAINPDGQTLASVSTDGIINIWNLRTRKLLQQLSGRGCVAFSPDGKTLVSGGEGGIIKIWRQMLSSDKSIPESVLFGQWWEVLGVDRAASPKDVKGVYLRLARRYHPDVNGSTNAKAAMQAINQAYKEYRQKVNALNLIR